MLAAVGAGEFAGMRPLAGADDADVATARSVAVDWPIELYLEVDEVHDHHAPSLIKRSALAAAGTVSNMPMLCCSALNASRPSFPRLRMKPRQTPSPSKTERRLLPPSR